MRIASAAARRPGGRMKRWTTLVWAVPAVLALAACTHGSTPAADAKDGLSGTIVVDAASSLDESFNQVRDEFEPAPPHVHVSIGYAGSSSLAASIVQGAPADVFAS